MELELPSMFRCPISLEVMENPVTIATGVTYERRSIEKWLFTYKKSTCPATMQPLPTFDLIPNHTLKRLIYSWRVQNFHCVPSPPSSSSQHHDLLTSLLSSMDSSPFKVSSLKKLRSFTTTNPSLFVSSGGVNALRHIILQSATDPSDHAAFLAGEEALGVLDTLPFDGDEDILGLLSKPDSIKTMLLMLQRGGADARFHAMAILQRVSKARPTIAEQLNLDIDVFKSLLDLLSDDMSTLLSHSSLHFLLEAVAGSQVNRVKAVEAEALRVLIELLPDAGRQRSEKTLLMLKRLCECAEGRSAFADHALGVVAVANKIGRECDVATKLGVKVLWLICGIAPTKRVLEDMVACGAVRKLLSLINVDGTSSTKEKALRMLKMHGHSWKQSPCFPYELRAVQY